MVLQVLRDEPIKFMLFLLYITYIFIQHYGKYNEFRKHLMDICIFRAYKSSLVFLYFPKNFYCFVKILI